MISQKSFYKLIQTVFFGLISFTLVWALWTEIPYNTVIYTVACFGLFVLNLAAFQNRNLYPYMLKIMPVYACLAIWSAFMVIGYGFFYSVHTEIDFLFYNTDSYAVFFMKVFLIITPCMFFVDFNKLYETKFFKITVGIILVTSTLFTIRATNFYSDALRARDTMELRGEEEYLLGTPGYAIIYGLALLFPIFLQKCKDEKGKSRWFYIISTMMIAYMIIASQFATASILALIGTIVFLFFYFKGNTKLIFFFVVTTVVVFVHGFELDSLILSSLSNKVDGTWSVKLQDMADSLSSGDFMGSLLSRTDLYGKSFQAFLESPLFGKLSKPTNNLGGHATAIDTLGLVGIVGFIPLMFTVWFQYKRMKYTCNYMKNKSAINACVIEFIILIFLKNIVTSFAIFFSFFVLAPLLLKIQKDDSKK